MKPGIHPTWYPESVVTCACGNTFTTGSTKKEIHTDVCSNCHPFFTGEQRLVDTAGQVERFMKRASAKEKIAATRPVGEKKRDKKEERRDDRGHLGEKPAAIPIAPADLPLAIAEEKLSPRASASVAPELPTIEMPALELTPPEPVAEAQPTMPEPIASVETVPTLPMIREPKPVTLPVTKAAKRAKPAKAVKKPAAKKTPARKPEAKKKTAPKAKIAKTAKATKSVKKSPTKKPAKKSKK